MNAIGTARHLGGGLGAQATGCGPVVRAVVRWWVLAGVVWVAGVGAAPGAEGALADLLDQVQSAPDPIARCRAAESLATYGAAAVPHLCELLRSSDRRARGFACLSLNRIGPAAAAAVPTVMAVVANPSEPDILREDAALALERIGPGAAAAVPVLRTVVRENRPELRQRGIRALAAIHSPESIAVLAELAQERSRDLSRPAVEALRTLGPQASAVVPILLRLAGSRPESELAEDLFLTVAAVGREAVPELTAYLRADQPATRRRAALALSRIGPDAAVAVSALQAALGDETPPVRFWAARALANIGAAAWPAAQRLAELAHDPDPNVRWEAAKAVTQITAPATGEPERAAQP